MTRRASIRRLSLCSESNTVAPGSQLDDRAETDVDVNLGRKSDDSSKFEHYIQEVEVFLPQYDHCGSSDVGGLSRKIRLEQKSMTAKFDVGGQK